MIFRYSYVDYFFFKEYSKRNLEKKKCRFYLWNFDKDYLLNEIVLSGIKFKILAFL